MNEGEKFFVRIMVRAFGLDAEAAAVAALVKSENDGEVPKGVFVDKKAKDLLDIEAERRRCHLG